ncbi:MAG: peptidoglycan-binding protein [Clostridia bacterium]|nr:peptidoglycan-binding protein [Clostridia bacterium]MBP3650477.1 peptidoglycan-binding protein [Clostridia bacterium]
MLTPIINVILALTLAVTSAFGSLFAVYVPMIGEVRVIPGGATATVEPVAPVVTPQPDQPAVTDAPAVASEYTTIQRGQSGEAVLALQQRLTELGYYTGKLTGKMDSPTQLAFKKFEKSNGFNANGIASPEEQMVLFSEAAIAAE